MRAPIVVGMSMTIGSGAFMYRALHPFGELPDVAGFGNTSHVATDSTRRVYVFQSPDPSVLVFEPDGSFVGSWGTGMTEDAHGLFVTESDELWLSDRGGHELVKCSRDGEVLQRLGIRDRPQLDGPFNHPAAVAVSRDGEIFVADGYGNSRVHRFAPDGQLRHSWGSRGHGRGQMTTPHGICLDDERRQVYVCDRENNRVQIFTWDGEYVSEWTDFYHPMSIFRDSEGFFYVTDQVPRLSIFDRNGVLLARGMTYHNGHHVCVDAEGDVYVAQRDQGVTKFSRLR